MQITLGLINYVPRLNEDLRWPSFPPSAQKHQISATQISLIYVTWTPEKGGACKTPSQQLISAPYRPCSLSIISAFCMLKAQIQITAGLTAERNNKNDRFA